MSSMKEVFYKYYYKLIRSLPMTDALFVARLFSTGRLRRDAMDIIMTRATRAERASFFLDKYIDAGFVDDNSNPLFVELLSVMEESDDIVVKLIAEKIKTDLTANKINTELSTPSGSLLVQKPEMEKLRKIVVPRVKGHWKNLAYCMRYSIRYVIELEKAGGNDHSNCCANLFSDWLESSRGPMPKTYRTLLNHIKKVDELTAASKEIEDELIKVPLANPKVKDSLTSTPKLIELLEYFEEVAKWDGVCPFLLKDCTGVKITVISYNNHGNVARCCSEMLETFLRESFNPTWRDVVNALRSGKYNNLADRIEGDL